MKPKIKHTRPPNFDLVAAAFPGAWKPGVVFSYHDTIYVPSGMSLPQSLIDHETVHLERQQKIGVGVWWDKYIDDPEFRYNEELLAHRVEYKAMSGGSRQ